MQSLFYQNTSLIALQLAIPAAIALWLLFNNNKYKKIYFLIFIILTIVLVLLQSRTSILALLAAFFYSAYPAFTNERFKRRTVFIIVFALIAAIIVLAFCFKSDSSQGRWYIWKLSFQLLRDNWLFGIGWGKFNVDFNHEQADYFANHSLYSKEALLASDGYFAFNEWFRFAIELGLAGLLVSIAITIILLRRILAIRASKNGWAGSGVIAIFMGCLFSYPLSNFFILITFLVLIIFLYSRSTMGKRVIYPLCITSILFLSIAAVKQVKQQLVVSHFSELNRMGYKTEAFNYMAGNSDRFTSNPEFNILYLNLLYETNRLSEAIDWFNCFHISHCSYRAHQIIAMCYEEKKQIKIAEYHYRISLYIKPQLLETRINLMEFYTRNNIMDKARYWANEVIHYPAKFDNPKVERLRMQARNFLKIAENQK